MALWRTSQETLEAIITVVRGGDSLDRAERQLTVNSE